MNHQALVRIIYSRADECDLWVENAMHTAHINSDNYINTYGPKISLNIKVMLVVVSV